MTHLLRNELSLSSELTTDERRRALRLGYVNGALWAMGNSLTTGFFITYLALELGARGRQISLIIALPSIVGMLRLFSPRLIQSLRGIKRTCLAMSIASYLLLAVTLPTFSAPWGLSRKTALWGLLLSISLHQFLEYFAMVSLWSWLGRLAPSRIRGRYFGRRQFLGLACLIPVVLFGGWFTDSWKERYQKTSPDKVLWAYTIPTTLGSFFLLGSLIPLAYMPNVSLHSAEKSTCSLTAQDPQVPFEKTNEKVGLPSLFTPWRDSRFRGFLWYRAWFSFFNGITQAAQNIYPRNALHLGVFQMNAMVTTMRLGQMGLSPWVGRSADRWGNRPLLLAAQFLVALAFLFYLLATPEQPHWLWGAWIMWIAYVVHNICLPNLTLKLASPQESPAYMAMFEAVGGGAYALSVLVGGELYDLIRDNKSWTLPNGETLDIFTALFVFGLLTRAAGTIFIARVEEPGARDWKEILSRQRP